jgi:hypothetical protein
MKVTNQQRMQFAQSDSMMIAIDILKRCCKSSQTPSLIGNSAYRTLVNAVILETEGAMLSNFINEVEQIKKGKLYEEEITQNLIRE